MTSTMPVTTAPKPLMQRAASSSPALSRPAPVDHHAGLRQGERDEHADHVERQQRLRVAAERDDEDRREDREHQDAVREREPVALVHELARQVAIARHDRRQPREVGVRGVRRQHEDQRRAGLEQVVEDVRPAEDRPAELRDPRLGAVRHHLVGVRQHRDADEHPDRQRRHRDERRRRVLRLGRTERRHAVRHRLDAGHRRAAVRERRQQQERRQRLLSGVRAAAARRPARCRR